MHLQAVTLFVPDMYYSGAIIDHGRSVSSTHLSKGHVEAGTTVKQRRFEWLKLALPVAPHGPTSRLAA
jgi:hypothetical protein